MRILLIEPRLEHGIVTYKKRYSPFSRIYGNPSLTLPMVAAVTPPNHEIKIVNENYEKIDFSKDYDLVGISVLTINAFRSYDLADQFRSKGAKVVLGGYHVSALPDEAKEHADAVIVGEAELLWPQIIRDIKKGKLKKIYYSVDKPDVAVMHMARR